MKRTDLKRYFERVVLINLKRRPDRLARAKKGLRACGWPFKMPEVFEAVDGHAVPCREGWKHGPGAWGCMLSQQQILKKAIADRVESLLVLEDDVCFEDDFRERVDEFLDTVPDDWDGLMLGGQHINTNGKPTLVAPGVYRCTDCERMHCYAVRGSYMRKLYKRLQGGGAFDGNGHCDWIMGRDPDMQPAHKIYAPESFLVGQEGGKSDINGAIQPRAFWNPPGPDLVVVNLHAPVHVAVALRDYGFHIKITGDREKNGNKGLPLIFKETKNDPVARVNGLREWIKLSQWEIAADPRYISTVWHPEATPELVKAASLWNVIEITAQSVDDAIKQLPRKLQRVCRKNAAAKK